MPLTLRTFRRTAGYFVGSIEDLLVTALYAPELMASLDAIDACEGELLQKYPAGIVALSMARGMGQLLDLSPQARKRAEELTQKYGKRTRASAVFVEGDRLVVSVAKALTATISFLFRDSGGTRAFGSMDEALQFLAKHSPASSVFTSGIDPVKDALLAVWGGSAVPRSAAK